jgi:multidrug efflux system outer membrane protein
MKKKALILLFFTSCNSNFKAPEVALNDTFITQTASLDEKAFNARYWENLNDPTLNRLVELVEEKNYTYLQAQEKINELRAQYKFQNSQLFPQISGGQSLRRERDTQTLTFSQFTGNVYQTIYQLGFDMVWELDFFGAQMMAKKGAYFSLASQVENSRYVKISLIAELVLNYVNLRNFQALIQVYENQVKVLEEIQKLAANRYNIGLKDKTDTLLDQARVLEKKALIEKTKQDVDKLIYLITKLTGQFPQAEVDNLKKEAFFEDSLPLIYPNLPSTLVLNRPDVASARFKLFTQQALLKKAYRDFFPQFNITSAFGTLTNFPNYIFSPSSLQWDIMPGFNLTLIDFGALIAQKNAAKSQEKQALYEYENSLVNAFSEIETALSGVKNTDMQIGELEKEKASLREKSIDFEKRYSLGVINKSPFLESYLEELYLKEALLNASNNRIGFAISFYKAVGVVP